MIGTYSILISIANVGIWTPTRNENNEKTKKNHEGAGMILNKLLTPINPALLFASGMKVISASFARFWYWRVLQRVDRQQIT